MIERPATVKNADGIHCRPSVLIVKAMASYPGRVTLTTDRGSSDVKSVMTLMMMAMGKGCLVRIRVEGPDEERTCAAVVELIERQFDFPNPAPVASSAD